MKVLIITYYWPPAGGSGVQRWLKFVKYLPEFGITPVVFTVDEANYPKEDKSLLDEIPDGIEILRQPIYDPTNIQFWKKTKNQKKDISNATNSSFLSFVRGNFFIPDPKIFWVKPSVKTLNNYLKENNIDVIISTGPPHSVHLIAKKLKEKHAIKWLADFRDPWSDLYYQKEFKQLSFARRKNTFLENSVFKSADCILTVSNFLKSDFKNKSKRVEVITNGFDNEVQSSKEIQLDEKFSISYIGLLPKQSNPKNLFKVLGSLCETNLDFKNDLQLNFVGDISDEVKEVINRNNLENKAKFYGYVSHKKAIDFQKKSQVLLLLIPNVKKSEGILTGKLFEYLTANRPILALSPSKGDLFEILSNTNSGNVFSYDDNELLSNEILRLYNLYKSKKLFVNTKNVNQYHRKNLTKSLSELLKNLNS